MYESKSDSPEQPARTPIEVRLIQPASIPQHTSRVGQCIALIKAAAWPVVVLVLYSQLHVPITKLFEELPKALSQSSKLSVGSLSIEIQRSLKLSDPLLADKLKGLSESEIQELLDLYPLGWQWIGHSNDKTHYYFTRQERIDVWKKLNARGLVTFNKTPEAFTKEIDRYPWTSKTTEEGVLKSPTNAQVLFLEDQATDLSDDGKKVITAAFGVMVRAMAEEGKTP